MSIIQRFQYCFYVCQFESCKCDFLRSGRVVNQHRLDVTEIGEPIIPAPVIVHGVSRDCEEPGTKGAALLRSIFVKAFESLEKNCGGEVIRQVRIASCS